MTKVSVVIPCFNQGPYLDEAVDSVTAQTFPDVEIVVVDDGSTDPGTVERLDGYDTPNVRVLRIANQGLAAARNAGIREAAGKYILPLDADDRIGPRYLEEAVSILDRDPDMGIVYCEAACFGVREGLWEMPEYSVERILRHNVIFCSALFRKADWEAVGGFNPNMVYGWEDWDFWLSLIGLKRKVYRIPKVHFYYRLRHSSMVQAMDEEKEFFMRLHACLNHRDLYRHVAEIQIQPMVAELYLDTGLGFNNRQALRRIVFADDREIVFDLRPYRGLRRLRLDPVNRKATIHLRDICLRRDGGEWFEIPACPTNALVEKDRNLLFHTGDPQILIDLPEAGDFAEFRARLHFVSLGPDVDEDLLRHRDQSFHAMQASLNGQIEAMRSDLEAMRGEVARLRDLLDLREQTIREIYGSTSWRITGPLRRLRGLCGRGTAV